MQGTGEAFRIDLLGRFAVSHNGQPIDVSRWQRRHAQLMRMLAASPGNRLMREMVIDLLWPESSPDAGSTNLRYAVHLIRRALPATPPVVVLEREWVALNPAHTWVIDLAQFEEAVVAASDDLEELQRAARLYTGPPLSEDTYEDWARPVQERVAVQWQSLRFRLLRGCRAQGKRDDALLWCQSLLESDPVDEPAMQDLMMILTEAGQVPEALRRYQMWEELLWDEVGVKPSPETQALAEQLKARVGDRAEGGSSEHLPHSSRPARPVERRPSKRAYWMALAGAGALVAGTGVALFATWKQPGTTTPLPVLASWPAGISRPIHFTSPSYVAVGPRGTVYITEGSAPRLQEVSPDGEVIRQWATVGEPSTVVSGIAVDGLGHPYISDAHCDCVRKLSTSGRVLRTLGSHGTAAGQFNRPAGLDLDGDGNLYVADLGNNRVQKLSPGGKVLKIWGGKGSAVQLRHPNDVAVSAAGDVFVADTGHDRILMLSPTGAVRRTWGRPGTAPGTFRRPTAVDVDASGDVYVVDRANQRVQRISPSTHRITVWGKTGRPGSRGRQFHDPLGIAVDGMGSIYVADTDNSRVQKLSVTGHPIGIWGADQSLFPELARPNYTAVDRRGDLFVSDTGNNRILKYSRDGVIVDRLGRLGTGPGEFTHPAGLAVDPDGSLYVADTGNNRIQHLTAWGHPLGTWGSGGSAAGEFSNPEGLALDGAGHLFVADRGNARIEVINVRSRRGYAERAVPLPLPSGWRLNQPKGVALDRAGRLYIADAGNRRILIVSGRGKAMTIRRLTGPRGSALFEPTGIAVGASGRLYVSDTLDSCIDSLAGSDSRPPRWSTMCDLLHSPGGLTTGAGDRLFVADTGHSRILVLDGRAIEGRRHG